MEYQSESESCPAKGAVLRPTDKLLENLKEVQDLDALDEMLCEIEFEVSQKADELKLIRKENDALESEINSTQSVVSQLHDLLEEERQKINVFEESIEAKHQELDRLYVQQVNALERFEKAVENVSAMFTSAPHDYDSNALTKTVLELHQDLETKASDFTEYRETLQGMDDKFKQNQEESTELNTTVKVFEEDVDDISSLNKKLAASVEQLTNKVNFHHYE